MNSEKDPDPVWTVAQAAEWGYAGRNFSFPAWNTIVGGGTQATAAAVFKELRLPIERLRDIYHGRAPLVADPRDEYEALGCLPIDDATCWSRLAQLTGKTIRLIHRSGEPGVGCEIAVYYPDGRIEPKP